FVSGGQTDALAKFNLRNMVDSNGAIVPDAVKVFERLCNSLGLSGGMASLVAQRLSLAVLATQAMSDPAAMAQIGGSTGLAAAPLMPQSLDDLLWLGQGLDAGLLERLRPYVTLLPEPGQAVNINTASKEVLAAAAGLDSGTALRVVQARASKSFRSVDGIRAVVGPNVVLPSVGLDVASSYFEAEGRIRIDDFVIVQRNLLHRDGQTVDVKAKSRLAALDTR
ncbi:MAG: hypothetical protein RI907_2124, partial [Pseudomonadota bacterium]